MAEQVVCRKEEQETLERLYESKKSEMAAIIGRRRVGKTFLVKKVFENSLGFELTGIQNISKQGQLQNFAIQFRQHFPAEILEDTPSNWLEAFSALAAALEKKFKKRRTVIFLDELPWLASPRSGFLSGLSWFWNSWAEMNNVLVVICGSATSWMIQKVINHRGGLHNRVTHIMELYPFTLLESEIFLKYKGIKLNRYHISQLYMVMGGIPMYLEQLDSGLSAVENIQRICFERTGYLRYEFERLFSSLFEGYEKHEEVIRILAGKWQGMTRGEIVEASSMTNGGALTKVLTDLEQSGFIDQYSGFKKKSKDSLFRLTDPYSLFYVRFLEPLGKNAHVDFTRLSDLPQWKSWSGYAFENLVLKHVGELKEALGIGGIYSKVSSFLAKKDDSGAGAQIDLVIDRADQSMNICEIKFSANEYELTTQEAQRIRTRKDTFRRHTKTKKHLFTTMITTYGLIRNKHSINEVDHSVTLEDLFK